MATSLRNTWTTFTASEVEKITGVSTTTQRDWRRRGFLEATDDGWTRYELHDLCQLLVMSALQERGVGPSLSKDIAGVAALHIAFFALSWVDSIDDGTSGEFEKLVRLRGEPRGAFFVRPSAQKPLRYLVVWATGEIGLVEDIGAAFSQLSSDRKYHGAIIVLDLDALATLLIDRAGRPFVSVEIASGR